MANNEKCLSKTYWLYHNVSDLFSTWVEAQSFQLG